jgi:hypothetical protein
VRPPEGLGYSTGASPSPAPPRPSEALVKAVEEACQEEDTAAIIEATADLLEAVAVVRGDLRPAQRFPKIDNCQSPPSSTYGGDAPGCPPPPVGAGAQLVTRLTAPLRAFGIGPNRSLSPSWERKTPPKRP